MEGGTRPFYVICLQVLLIFGIGFMLISTYDNIQFNRVEDHIPAPKVVEKIDKVKVDDLAVIEGIKKVEKPNVDVDKLAEKMGLQGEKPLSLEVPSKSLK